MPHATCQRGSCTPTSRAQTGSHSRPACKTRWNVLQGSKRCRKDAQGHSRQRFCKVLAAAAPADTAADLKQLLQDALQAPQLQSDSSASGATTPPPSTAEASADLNIPGSLDTKELDTSNLPAPSSPDQGQVGPTAEGVSTQAQSRAQAVGSQAEPATQAQASSATEAITSSAAPAAEAIKSQADSASEAVKSQVAPVAEAIKSQADSASEALKSQAQDVVPSQAETVTQGLQTPATWDSVTESIKAAGEQVQEQLKSSSDLLPSTSGPSEAFSSAVQQANEATTLAVQSVQEASSEVFEGINQAGADLQSSAEAAAASVSSQVGDAASSVLDAVPAPVSEALQAAFSAVQPSADAFWTYARSDPKAGATAAGLLVGLPLLAFWRARLSGYSGQLQPAKVLDLLNKTNSLLVDIRKEEVRDRDGVPLLRRGSRGKGAAFAVQPVSAAVLRNSKQGQSIRLQIAALQILGLKQVNRRTRLVLMDRAGGSSAIALARSIRQLSRRKVYIVAGGFSAWEKQGLDTEGSSTEYQSTVFDSLSDEAETLAESAVSFLRDPVVALGAFGGVGLAGVALVDWHYALQYVGVVGAQVSLIQWLASYDSPQDALSDVGSTVQKYSQKASRLIGSKAASPGPQPALSDGRYEPSVGLNDDDQELDSDSKLPSRDSTKGEKASISQTP